MEKNKLIKDEIAIKYFSEPQEVQINHITQGLNAYAEKMRNMPYMEQFAFFLMQEQENFGGIHGYIYYGCLHIEQFWMHEDLRRHRYGSKLLTLVEELALRKNCLFAVVNTMDWEAKDFYLKHNFYVELIRKGFLDDAVMYLMRKDF